MRNNIASMVFAVLIALAAEPGSAQSSSTEEMRSLDEQVQEIKSDVLMIAADLNRLEERLIYPSSTQVAVFVGISEGETFRLDAIQLDIDGELATRYIYSFKELDALEKGGVQRLYTGNVPTGAHELNVTVEGQTASGRDFSRTETYAFTKGIEPALLGVTLPGPEAIQVESW